MSENGIGGNDFHAKLRTLLSKINSNKAQELSTEDIDKIYKAADAADKEEDGIVTSENLFESYNSMLNLGLNMDDVEEDYLKAFTEIAGNDKTISSVQADTTLSAEASEIAKMSDDEIKEKRLGFESDIMKAETELWEAQTKLNEIITEQDPAIKSKKDAVNALHTAYVAAVSSKSPSLGAQIAQVEEDINGFEKELDKIEAELNNQEAAKARAEQEKKEAEERKNLLESKLNSLGADASESEIETLKNQINECTTIIENATATIENADSQIKSLTAQQKTCEENLAASKANKSNYDEMATDNSADLKELLKNYTDAKEEFRSEKEKAKNNAKKVVNEKKTKLENLKSKLFGFENLLSELGKVIPNIFTPGTKCDNAEYNGDFGSQLVNYTQSHLRGTTGHCAGGVSDTLAAVLGNGPNDTNWRLNCDAWQAADVLSNSKFSQYFTEVTGQYTKNDIANLPAGAIVVFGKNSSKQWGHICIMDGNGNQMSDWKGAYNPSYYENNFFSKGSSLRIFLPK